MPIPLRDFGSTGRQVTAFGLGGEGVLRTRGREAEATLVIEKALELGVTYFDTAPAYASSMDYLGAVIPPHRNSIFLACKTAERSRDGSLRVLEDALHRLRVDSFDLWQLHDIRTMAEVDRIFGPGGAIEALLEARTSGLVKHLGVTGHHDPEVLRTAVERFHFDSVLMPVSPADYLQLPFLDSVLPAVRKAGAACVAMKVYSGGLVPEDHAETVLRYALSQPGVSTAIIGCRTTEEVERNAAFASRFVPMSDEEQAALQSRFTDPGWTPYKRAPRATVELRQ
ncbi:MAG TPA: aldo/keto reductase [Bryobacteraceae bacterium]|nr:aldo/keto reductase [Bryobacteraceae bacterium]